MGKPKPYIPEAHEKYNLLPLCRENGGEVFSYPGELSVIDDILQERESEDTEAPEHPASLITPYSFDCYEDYYAMLERYAEKYRGVDPELSDAILALEEAVRKMNVKEEWSVVRYVGEDLGNAFSLTPGRYYYWPCSIAHPDYEGVIDNEEFTSYLYPCDPACWEIAEDPTGMAARALAGEADTVEDWVSNLFDDAGDKLGEAVRDGGLKIKRERKAFVMDFEEDESWSSTDIDEINIPCPQCGTAFAFDAWTLVNARENPEAVPRIVDGSLFEFRCPECGYEAHLAHPCLYIDPDRRACVYSVIDDRMAGLAEEMFADPDNAVASSSTCRIVRGREELAEKVLCLASGLDDRAVELLKFGIRGSVKMQGLVGEGEAVVARLEAADAGSLTFGVECGDQRFVTDMDIAACKLFEDALMKSSIAGEQPVYVDVAWGEHALDVIEAEGTMA